MQFQDYYETLGISKSASADEVKRAYRKLAAKYHPDSNDSPEAEAKFKQASEAYEVLSDPDKRARYDQLGANYKAGQDFRPPPGFEEYFRGGGGQGAGGFEFHADSAGGFSDFFRTVFGNAGGGAPGGAFDDLLNGQRGGHRQAAPLSEHELTITLLDAYHGTTRSLSVQGQAGQRTIDVKIPAGVVDGSKVRLAREGLQLIIRLDRDDRFEVTGRNLTRDAPVPPHVAVLGGKADVQTLDGAVTVTIPPGTQSGAKLRLKGRGLPALKASDTPGDLFVRVMVQVPRDLSDEQRAAYETLRDLDAFAADS